METYQILVIAILLVLREGFAMDNKPSYWKPIGMAIRLLIVLLVYPNILLMLILSNILWTGYDISCAIGLKQKWYYLGTTNKIDKWGWINYTIKGILLILTIIFILC